jgi:pimeloyl-ACP methyl ester carboxylesterase
VWAALLAHVGTELAAQAERAALVHETVEGARAPTGVSAFTTDAHGLRFSARGEAVLVPHCAGRGKVFVDDVQRDAGSKGPLVLRLGGGDRGEDGGDGGEHRVRVEIKVSAYEKRVACSEAPRAGAIASSALGLTVLRFASPHGRVDSHAGQVVVFVPRGHALGSPGALLVGVHPWNGDPWTYAAYEELLDEAQKKDVVLAMPSGLGNSLYTADAEDEVLRAIDAVSRAVAVDPARVSIWGASMGGAGATTISFHHPDRFAFVASYFGDSKYDLTTYVRSVLGGEAGAHRVNALDVLENARHLPVLLVHGEADRTSPIVQSTMLYDAMKKAGFRVDFERVPGMGHEGPLVVRFVRRVVDRAAEAKAPVYPARVSYRSVRAEDTGAYGVRLVRSGSGDAVIDLEGRPDGVHVLRAEGIAEVVLTRGALGGATKIADADGVRVRFGD